MNEIVIDKTGLEVENLDLENAVKIIYKVDDTEYIIKHLTDLNNFELKKQEEKKPVEVHLNFKSLSFDTRLEILRWALTKEDLIDASLVLNIFNLIKGYSTFDKTFFDSEEVMFNKATEFLDFKRKLTTERSKFLRELARYYFSAIKSCGIVEYAVDNPPLIIPFVYQRILLISDFITMSNMLCDIVEVNNLVNVANARFFIDSMSTKNSIANIFIKSLGVQDGLS